jgi:dGTPase
MITSLYSNDDHLKRYSGANGVDPDKEPGRSPFRKDYSRLLHAPSFRRLQGKTQLFPGVESDFFRNRLTHSLEVAQIAQGIASKLNAEAIPQCFAGAKVDEDLVEFAAIAHDLGHPPFGHNGEHALDELMKMHGGFEGNAQTLRILSHVERKLVRLQDGSTSAEFGLDLTYRSLASILKYDHPIKVQRQPDDDLEKGYYASEQALVKEIKRRVSPGLPHGKEFKTIECSIMDIADDIAYSTYDLEDSLHAGFVSPLSLLKALAHDSVVRDEVTRKTNKALQKSSHPPVADTKELMNVVRQVFDFGIPQNLTRMIMQKSRKATADDVLLLNLETWMTDERLKVDSIARTKFTAERVGNLIAAVELVPNNEFPQLSVVRMARKEMLQVEILKHLNYELVIRSPRLAVVEHRGKEVVEKIFKTLSDSDGALLPIGWKTRHDQALQQGRSQALRVICDYVACMTDRYAAELFARLFGEGLSMYKPL